MLDGWLKLLILLHPFQCLRKISSSFNEPFADNIPADSIGDMDNDKLGFPFGEGNC
jgi:hypothetical protein